MDNRLICNRCGELGKVVRDGDGFRVMANRDGKPCCQTFRCATKEAAIARWETLWCDNPCNEFKEAQRG